MKSRFAALFACAFVAGCSGTVVQSGSPPVTPVNPVESVVVIQKPVYIQRGAFVEIQNAHSSKGLTEWFFHCYPDFGYSVSNNPLAPNEVTITITKVTLTISCPITLRVGINPNQATLDHETGHVQIVKQIYADGVRVATDACKPLIGKSFTARGGSPEEAKAKAVDMAARETCQRYTEHTVLVANELSKYYDEITQHGYAKISVPNAINLANEKYKKSIIKPQL